MSGETKSMSGSDAIRLAIEEEMERDESVFILGEDIGSYGGTFFVTKGLLDKFGAERVRETPISENAILGCAVGAAIAGMRPIAEIMFADFLTVCMEMIVNQAAKARYMYGAQISVPVTIRVPFGTGIMGAAQHSQSFESWFMHVPGLKVVCPSDPADFKGLFKTSVRDDDPVIFFENKQCYFRSGEVPLDKNFTIPFGQARKFTEGDDVTITFSEPFDTNGVWDTGYDDAGEYVVTVTASDGISESEETFTVVVNDVNRPPTFAEGAFD